MDLRPYLFCLSFYLLYFVLPPFEDNGLPFWVTDVLCQHSEVVLWNLLGIQMFFWWICGGRSRLPILLLRHLRTASLSCFSDDPVDVGNLISGSSAFSKTSLNIWKFMVHVLLKPDLENFKHHFTSVWDECNCVVVWAFFGIAFLWDWNENWTFLVLWPLLSFSNLLTYWVQHFHSIIFQDLNLGLKVVNFYLYIH